MGVKKGRKRYKWKEVIKLKRTVGSNKKEKDINLKNFFILCFYCDFNSLS